VHTLFEDAKALFILLKGQHLSNQLTELQGFIPRGRSGIETFQFSDTLNPFLKRLIGEKSLLKVAIEEDDGEAGGEVLNYILLILNELMGRNTFTLCFIINNSDEAQVAKFADCKALFF
jgi:hypothetical protein